MKKSKVLIFTLVIVFLAAAALKMHERESAKYLREYASEDGAYLAKMYLVRDPILDFDRLYLIKIYDKDGQLIKTSVAFNDFYQYTGWDCKNGDCTRFVWGHDDSQIVDVPPTWLDRLRAKIP